MFWINREYGHWNLSYSTVFRVGDFFDRSDT